MNKQPLHMLLLFNNLFFTWTENVEFSFFYVIVFIQQTLNVLCEVNITRHSELHFQLMKLRNVKINI